MLPSTRFLLAASLALLAGTADAADHARDKAIQALLDGARASHSDTMLVVRDGAVLAAYRKPGEPSGGIEMMSATKSLVGVGIGRLLTQGKLKSIDQPVSDFYPQWKQGQKAKITVRMLLNHTSGLQNVPNTGVEIYPAPDGLKLALAAELSDPPGTHFSYNNKAMNLLAGIFEKASGQRMDLYLERQVLQPLGIDGPAWNADGFDRAGHPYAMAGWNATAKDAVKLGELVLDGGVWHGKRLIDADYMQQMTAQSQPFTPAYGLLWWRRSAETTAQVDAGKLDALEAKGVDKALLERLRPLAGRSFQDSGALRAAISAALGADLKKLGADLAAHDAAFDALLDIHRGPIVAYEANGYLGQYIVVVPKAHIVAVRQVRGRDDYDGSTPWPDGYDDFTKRVVTLARTYSDDLAVPDR